MKKLIILLVSVFVLGFMGVAMAQDQTLNDCCRVTPFKEGSVEYTAIGQGIAKDSTKPTELSFSGNCSVESDINKIKPLANWGIECMLNTVKVITNWIFYIMTILAVLMVVYGGLIYITAAGDPSAAGKGKTILIYSMIGLAIALIAKLIPSLVRFIIGM